MPQLSPPASTVLPEANAEFSGTEYDDVNLVTFPRTPQPGDVMCDSAGRHLVCLESVWTANETLRVCCAVCIQDDFLNRPASDIQLEDVGEFTIASSASPIPAVAAGIFKSATVEWVDGTDLQETGSYLPSVFHGNCRARDEFITDDRQRMHRLLYDGAFCKQATEFYDQTTVRQLPPNTYVRDDGTMTIGLIKKPTKPIIKSALATKKQPYRGTRRVCFSI